MATSADEKFVGNAVEAAIKIGMLFVIVIWCFEIIRPFVLPVVWGMILAVALGPLFRAIRRLLGGRNKLAATVLTLLALAVLITPTIMLSTSMVEGTTELREKYEAGQLKIPPPSSNVKEWPLIGEGTYNVWNQASSNLEGTIKKYESQLKVIGEKLITGVAGIGGGILQFIISIIIAGVMLANAERGAQLARAIAVRFAGRYGDEFATLAGNTIRSVAQGLVGIALIQGLLSAIGLLVMDVPFAGLWVVMVVLLAIVQLPPILILGPIAAYTFTTHDTTPAVIFTIYALIVSMSDGILKPMLLGRGVDIPMLVILLGAIGGMILSGIIGLFVGAVVLALGYKLFIAWLDMNKTSAVQPEPESA